MATAEARNVATEAATYDSACRARHRRVVSNWHVKADARQACWADIALAGETGRGSPANLRASVVFVMLVARGVTVEARAQLADDVEVTIPVGEHLNRRF